MTATPASAAGQAGAAAVGGIGAQRPYRAVLMRGGTSRALIFRGEDLPDDAAAQDRLFLAAMGCPDPSCRQVDGLGGGASSNNKVAIVSASLQPGIDVDYTFGQLSPDRSFVDRSGNCGNISSAIGPFAINEGMVAPTGELTSVTIHNTNTARTIVAHVPTRAGRFYPEGDFAIAGVPGTGSRIDLDFVDPGGADTGSLLPTGNPSSRLEVPGYSSVLCSLVDAGRACVLIPFRELDLNAATRPDQVDQDSSLLERIEAVRAAGAVEMKLADTLQTAMATMPSVPQVAAFEAAGDHRLRVLGISMGKAHRALPLTAAVCLAAAAVTPGTLVHRALEDNQTAATAQQPLELIHPSGRMHLTAAAPSGPDGTACLRQVSIARTARRIFEGIVYVSANLSTEL